MELVATLTALTLLHNMLSGIAFVELLHVDMTSTYRCDPLTHTDVSLCVGRSKGKVGIQISCIPESRDTSSCILGEIYP